MKPLIPVASMEQGFRCRSQYYIYYHSMAYGFVAIHTNPLVKEVKVARFINSPTRIYQMPDLYSLLSGARSHQLATKPSTAWTTGGGIVMAFHGASQFTKYLHI